MNIQGEDRTSSEWERVHELGQGGFGNVCLYRNRGTNEHIAIKKVLLRPEFNDIATRVYERWSQEVYILKKLDHNCVIKAVDVPPELESGRDEFPALGMEYCQGGDLRKLISLPENCCGLREVYVRDLLCCMGSAIEYLHNKRIIHRDIKPENIVLQPRGPEDRFLYKIIDLGYAKELDASSSCMLSHVGTQQYLAPELNGKKAYTRTVDYWSLGSVVFECITGKRPFLPDLRSSVQWHTEVSKKSPDDITAFYDERQKIKFSKKIPGATHLCVPLKNYLEQWIKLMLRWDSKSRGGGVKKIANLERPKCFCVLEQILEMKIFHVMFAKANLLLSFPVNETHTIEAVYSAIQEKTNIPVNDQLLINRNGKVLQPNQRAVEACQDSTTENPAVFLFSQSPVDPDIVNKNELPKCVEIIVSDPQTVLPMERHKKVWKNVVYFCTLQNHAHKRLVASWKTSMLALMDLVKQITYLKEEMVKLVAFKEFFKMSLSFDLDQYSCNGHLNHGVNDIVNQNWLPSSKEEEEDIDNLVQQVSQYLSETDKFTQTFSELVKHQNVSPKLENCEKEAKALYDRLRSRRIGQEALEHHPMVDIIGNCVLEWDEETKSLGDKTNQVLEFLNLLRLKLPEVESMSKAIQTLKQRLVTLQTQRQEDVWKLSSLNNMTSLHLPEDASLAPGSLFNGNDLVLRSLSDPMESIRLVDDGKTHVQKVDNMLQSMEKDYEESMTYFSAVGK